MPKYWKRNVKTWDDQVPEYGHFYFSYSCFDNEILCCCQDRNKGMFSGDKNQRIYQNLVLSKRSTY